MNSSDEQFYTEETPGILQLCVANNHIQRWLDGAGSAAVVEDPHHVAITTDSPGMTDAYSMQGWARLSVEERLRSKHDHLWR